MTLEVKQQLLSKMCTSRAFQNGMTLANGMKIKVSRMPQKNISTGCLALVKAATQVPYIYTGSWLESTQVHNNKKYKHDLVPSVCVELEIQPMDSEPMPAHIDLYTFKAL